jgi:hypothetical protein
MRNLKIAEIGAIIVGFIVWSFFLTCFYTGMLVSCHQLFPALGHSARYDIFLGSVIMFCHHHHFCHSFLLPVTANNRANARNP